VGRGNQPMRCHRSVGAARKTPSPAQQSGETTTSQSRPHPTSISASPPSHIVGGNGLTAAAPPSPLPFPSLPPLIRTREEKSRDEKIGDENREGGQVAAMARPDPTRASRASPAVPWSRRASTEAAMACSVPTLCSSPQPSRRPDRDRERSILISQGAMRVGVGVSELKGRGEDLRRAHRPPATASWPGRWRLPRTPPGARKPSSSTAPSARSFQFSLPALISPTPLATALPILALVLVVIVDKEEAEESASCCCCGSNGYKNGSFRDSAWKH
jgi:hypothetical protein